MLIIEEIYMQEMQTCKRKVYTAFKKDMKLLLEEKLYIFNFLKITEDLHAQLTQCKYSTIYISH